MKKIDVSTPKFPNTFALVDDQDFDFLSQWKWYRHGDGRKGYVQRRESGRTISMHRVILGATDGEFVDHRDGDGLNNQRSNLRICNLRDNARNIRKTSNRKSSRFLGVHFDRARKAFVGQVRVMRKLVWFGRFQAEEEAAIARDAAAILHHGEFASLNFPTIPAPRTQASPPAEAPAEAEQTKKEGEA